MVLSIDKDFKRGQRRVSVPSAKAYFRKLEENKKKHLDTIDLDKLNRLLDPVTPQNLHKAELLSDFALSQAYRARIDEVCLLIEELDQSFFQRKILDEFWTEDERRITWDLLIKEFKNIVNSKDTSFDEFKLDDKNIFSFYRFSHPVTMIKFLKDITIQETLSDEEFSRQQNEAIRDGLYSFVGFQFMSFLDHLLYCSDYLRVCSSCRTVFSGKKTASYCSDPCRSHANSMK